MSARDVCTLNAAAGYTVLSPHRHWMDALNGARQRRVMPAPITKLSDRFADYTLRITCRKCKHERTTDPHALAKLMGWEAPLAAVAARMRCSKCNVRGECDLTAFATPKPRGYRSER